MENWNITKRDLEQITRMQGRIDRSADGREHRIAALIPNEKVRQSYYDRAKKLGMEVEIKNINE